MRPVYVWHEHEQRLKTITLHEHWVADNGFETAVFSTRDEAVHFAETRWRVVESRIRFVSPERYAQ